MIDAANKTKISVSLSDGTFVKGTVNIHKYNRLVDYLNSKEAELFIIIFDAEIKGTDDKVIMINRNQIVWAIPQEK